MSTDAPMPPVLLITDGSCLGNPGPGGWAAILRSGDHEKVLTGSEAATTNNRMELTAVVQGLRALTRPGAVTLKSDSQLVIKAFADGWLDKWQHNGWRSTNRSPVQNQDLWQAILDAAAAHTIQPQWVRGHDVDPDNLRVRTPARHGVYARTVIGFITRTGASAPERVSLRTTAPERADPMPATSSSSSRSSAAPAPTTEQDAIVDAMATGQPLRVLALAGTGKTTTLQLASQAVQGRRVLYLAFHRSVAEEARARFPRHVEARTAHRLALAAIGHAYGARLVSSPFAIRQAWPRWADARLRAQGLDRAQGLAAVTQTLTAFLHTAATQPGPAHVPPVAFAGRDPADRAAAVEAVMDLTRYFWRQAQDPTSTCPITHDVYPKRWHFPPGPAVQRDLARRGAGCRSGLARRAPAPVGAVGAGRRSPSGHLWLARGPRRAGGVAGRHLAADPLVALWAGDCRGRQCRPDADGGAVSPRRRRAGVAAPWPRRVHGPHHARPAG